MEEEGLAGAPLISPADKQRAQAGDVLWLGEFSGLEDFRSCVGGETAVHELGEAGDAGPDDGEYLKALFRLDVDR